MQVNIMIVSKFTFVISPVYIHDLNEAVINQCNRAGQRQTFRDFDMRSLSINTPRLGSVPCSIVNLRINTAFHYQI